MPDYSDRIALARHIIDYDPGEAGLLPEALGFGLVSAGLGMPWPAGLRPQPQPIDPKPDGNAPLPKADVLVVTWTKAEFMALADVITPGYKYDKWYEYKRNYDSYLPNIRKGAPARQSKRLGAYFLSQIGTQKVLCFKSDLHLNQDGIVNANGEGYASLPVKDLWRQIISEAQPSLVITVGTAGATFADHELGDVMITRAAKFRLAKEFKNAPFNGETFRSAFVPSMTHFLHAKQLMKMHAANIQEPRFGPPTKKYPWNGDLIIPPKNEPDLKIDGVNMPDFLPMLTTDYFEFGTSANELENEGCGVEMGDAVLGLVAAEMGSSAPAWLVIRNASDPQINGDLPSMPRALNMQAHWAVWYYETYGYWTSVNSAIATWAVIAGLSHD